MEFLIGMSLIQTKMYMFKKEIKSLNKWFAEFIRSF